MHPTGLPIFPAPAASSTRATAAGVKADRRSPAGLGLDTGEDRRTLATAGTGNTQVTFTRITCIMPRSARSGVVRGASLRRQFVVLVASSRKTPAGRRLRLHGCPHAEQLARQVEQCPTSRTLLASTRGSQNGLWLGQPLTTGVAMALLGANLVVMLAVALYIAHRLDLLDVYVGSLNR
jgi:hypothetical protein